MPPPPPKCAPCVHAFVGRKTQKVIITHKREMRFTMMAPSPGRFTRMPLGDSASLLYDHSAPSVTGINPGGEHYRGPSKVREPDERISARSGEPSSGL